MGKHNIVSGIIVLGVIFLIAISTFIVVSYVTGVLNAALAFASSDQIAKMQACGITAPPELYGLRSDVSNLVLPAIYIGLPGLLAVVAVLMFIAGHFYGGGKEEQTVSETTTTTSSPEDGSETGRYSSRRHVEQTRTHKSSRKE